MIQTSFIQLAVLFLLIMAGWGLTRAGQLNEERKKGLSSLLVNVVTPAVILTALQQDPSPERKRGMLLMFALGALSYCLGILVATLLVKKTDRYDYRILRFSMIYQNCGYMGIPFVQGVFGTESVAYVTPMIIMLNIFAYTHGLVLVRQSGEDKIRLRTFFTPAMAAVLIGFPLFFAGVRLPYILREPLSMLANLNSPIGMLVAGASIAGTDLKHIRHWGLVLKSVAVRLLVMPCITFLLLLPLPAEDLIKFILLTTAACPTATLCIVMAVRFDRDEALAAQTFSVSTLLSALTMPAILSLAQLAGWKV